MNKKLICFCGSLTKAQEAFIEAEHRTIKEGNIPLMPTCTILSKEQYRWLHEAKIRMCDEVMILNVDGYLGESTLSEIKYALSIDKPVKYLVNPNKVLTAL